MTWQSMIFLKQLKTIQKTEHGMLWIDYDNSQITNVICTGEEEKAISFSKIHGDVYLLVNYLQERNLIQNLGNSTIRLTHGGFHFWQTMFSELVSFVIRSILVPICVSILTTITLFCLERIF